MSKKIRNYVLGTQILLRQTDLNRTLPRQSEQKIAGWGLCFVHTFVFLQSVHRPCVHQRATQCLPVSEQFRKFAKLQKSRLFYNGGKRIN